MQPSIQVSMQVSIHVSIQLSIQVLMQAPMQLSIWEEFEVGIFSGADISGFTEINICSCVGSCIHSCKCNCGNGKNDYGITYPNLTNKINKNQFSTLNIL